MPQITRLTSAGIPGFVPVSGVTMTGNPVAVGFSEAFASGVPTIFGSAVSASDSSPSTTGLENVVGFAVAVGYGIAQADGSAVVSGMSSATSSGFAAVVVLGMSSSIGSPTSVGYSSSPYPRSSIIVDDGDVGFSTAGGGWDPFFGQGYQDDFTYHAAGTADETATWTFTGLTPGTYLVSATWTPSPNRATNAPFTILDGGTALGTVLIDQEQAPDDFSDVGAPWENLGGPYIISGTTLVVRLSAMANEFVIADAIRIELFNYQGSNAVVLTLGDTASTGSTSTFGFGSGSVQGESSATTVGHAEVAAPCLAIIRGDTAANGESRVFGTADVVVSFASAASSHAVLSSSGLMLIVARFATSGESSAVASQEITTASVALGLIAATQTRMISIVELVDALPGGIFFGPADEEADENPPYASWIMNGGEIPYYDTGGMFGKSARFQMRLVGPDEEELRRIHEEIWEEHFHPKMEPFAIANRVFRGWYDEPAYVDSAGALSPLGYNFVIRRWDFTVYTALNRVSG